MKWTFKILFLLFLNTNGFSQTFVSKHYTTNDGLPSSEVYYVFQDSKGFIWFATNFGVSRFDGYNFENFDNSHGLPDNTVFEIYEDYKGRIWFVSYSCRLSYFYNNSIHLYKYNDNLLHRLKQSPYSAKSTFYVDKDETVYIGINSEGIYKINKNGVVENDFLDYSKYPPKTYIFFNQYHVPCVNSNNLLNRIFSVNVQLDKVSFDFNYKVYKGSQSLRLAILTPLNHLLFSETNYLYDIKDSNHIVDYFFDSRIISMYNDREGFVWIGFYKDGVKAYKNGKIENGSSYHFLKDCSISNILRDKEGGLWFTTLEDGVYYVPSDKFHSYTVNEGLPNRVVSNIINDGKNIWASSDGLIKIHGAFVEKIGDFKQNNFYIYSLFYDSAKSAVWIGANYNLLKFDVLNSLSKVAIEKLTGVNDIARDSKGKLWFCSPLKIFNSEAIDTFYSLNKGNRKLLKMKSIAFKDDSCMFIGSMDGLWNLCNGKFSYLGNKHELLKNRINHLRFCKYNNTLFIGTKGQGLVLLNGEKVSQIDVKNGLLNNLVTNIFVDDSIVWVATDKGLNRIQFSSHRTDNYKIESFTHKNGLVSNEINSVYVSKSKVFVGTNSGITYFDYNEIKPNFVEPVVYIKRFKVMDIEQPINSVLDFKHDKNFITISFVGINYRNLGNLKYKYKLEGASEEWIETDNTTALFPSLSYGKYRFVVYACNESGLWCKKPAFVKFVINPPFWKTWWFFVIVFILIVFIIITYIKQRELRLKNDKLLLEQTVVERTAEVVMQKEEIETQRDEISEQKKLVDEVHKDITDSIQYAKKIQQAIIPDEAEFRKIFSDSFIFFKPRDIVSGDFYWFKEKDDSILIAVADCTGHGVPGAFMSMLGFAFLNEIVDNDIISEPNKILDKLRSKVIESFKHGNEKTGRRDGMDISLLLIKKNTLDAFYAGANNPIYIVKSYKVESYKVESYKVESEKAESYKVESEKNTENDFTNFTNFITLQTNDFKTLQTLQLHELKGDKMPIGVYEKTNPFSLQHFKLQKGECVYMFSDGYADQFGGYKGKKIMKRQFKGIIENIASCSMEEQKIVFKSKIQDWMAYPSPLTGKSHDQIDDILLIGFRV